MTNGKGRVLWLLFAAALTLLFLLSSTDWIIKERDVEIYSVSMIIEDARDDNYVNFRKGVDRAAIEMHADVGFFSLYDTADSVQQMNFILREQRDGVQALIVSPVDEQDVWTAIREDRILLPVILVNSSLSGERIAASVSPDFFQMGVMLAQEVIREQRQKKPVYLLSQETVSGNAAEFGEGIISVLEPAGWECRRMPGPAHEILEGLAADEAPGRILLALDQETLTETADWLSADERSVPGISDLYGRGSTMAILNYLDEQVITGTCVSDDFSAGYLSVKMAVEAASGQIRQEPVILDSYYIRKEDLTNPDYEKKLYPIE